MPKFKQYPGENPVEAAQRISENIAEEGIPMSNAQDRSVQTFFHGGKVTEGVTGQLGTPSISPVRELGQSPISPSPLGTRGYKKGGKVNKKKGYKK